MASITIGPIDEEDLDKLPGRLGEEVRAFVREARKIEGNDISGGLLLRADDQGDILATERVHPAADPEPVRDGEYTIVDDEIRCACGGGCGKTVVAIPFLGVVGLSIGRRHGRDGEQIVLTKEGALKLMQRLADVVGAMP